MSTEACGRIEYELDSAGKRTGRWRPREGSAVSVRQGMYRSRPPERWRKGGGASPPAEAVKK